MKLRNRNNCLRQLPLLTGLIVLFWTLGVNAHIENVSVPLPMRSAASLTDVTQPSFLMDSDLSLVTVLGPRDNALYRAAFSAQNRGDWEMADEAMGQIRDKRLFGHLYAERYLKQPADLTKIRQWMAVYADLPEATDLYKAARGVKGFAEAKIAQPVVANVSRSGGLSGGMSLGFHAQGENITRLRNKINVALHQGNPGKAHAVLAAETKHGRVDSAESNMAAAHVAAGYYYEGDIVRARQTAHVAAMAGIPLGLWIDGLSAWKQHDYVFANRSFASLAQAPGLAGWDHAAASYWAYRAAKHTGDKAQANHWLQEAAKYPRSFYGYVAARQLGLATASWQMPELNNHNIGLLAQYPAGWRALALAQIGKTDLAERELRRLPQDGRDLQNAELALAEKAHMASLTFQLGGVATNEKGQPYEAAAYPLPAWQPSSGFKVDRALIYAFIKHESQFNPAAVSPRGACGLMQIMPSTASRIDDNKSYRSCSNELSNPANNLELGQRYVRLLSEQPMIGDNLLLLLAAYNGGPGNLAHWLDGEDRKDPLLFIESVPLHETRDYVQQVLLQYWMYRSRLSEPESSVAQLARGEWPRYALTSTPNREASLPLTMAAR